MAKRAQSHPKEDKMLQAYGVEQILSGYFQAFAGFLDEQFIATIERIVHLLCAARDRGATIYIAGNGGSAATASHWVNDLGKATKCAEYPPIRGLSLNANAYWLPALA